MKKIIFSIVCCLLATIQYAHADEYGKIFLQHAGKITNMFSGKEMDKAITTATEGDTLFLSKGMFYSNFTINKSITLIGSGSDTNNYYSDSYTYFSWNGDSKIQADNDKEIASVCIEGIRFSDDFRFRGKVNSVGIKKCYFQNGFYFDSGSNYQYNKITIDRCRINNFGINGNIQELTAKNCKISYLSGQGGITMASCNFINCNVRQINTDTKAMLVNSVINQVGDGASAFLGENTILVNTLYHALNGYDPMEKTTQQDCWSTTETLISENSGDIDCTMTAEQLKAASYLGVDGTVIGVEGGVNPYSLTIHAPSINSKSATIDLSNKKVTINVNVTAN